MDTKRLREILQKFSSEDMNYGISIDQAIKEIQELSCDCHIIRDSAVKRVVEQQKIIEELEAKLSTPEDTDVTADILRMENKKLGGVLAEICKLLRESKVEKKYFDEADIGKLSTPSIIGNDEVLTEIKWCMEQLGASPLHTPLMTDGKKHFNNKSLVELNVMKRAIMCLASCRDKLSTPRLMEECPECGGKVRSLGTSLELYCKTCNGTGKKPSVTPNETCIVCNKPSKLVMCDKCLKKYKKRKNLK